MGKKEAVLVVTNKTFPLAPDYETNCLKTIPDFSLRLFTGEDLMTLILTDSDPVRKCIHFLQLLTDAGATVPEGLMEYLEGNLNGLQKMISCLEESEDDAYQSVADHCQALEDDDSMNPWEKAYMSGFYEGEESDSGSY